MSQDQEERKTFRIWLMEDLTNRKRCYGKSFEDLLKYIILKFNLSTYNRYELRNGVDGTIIGDDLDFFWQSENSILVLFNMSNNERWSDDIARKILRISPGVAVNGQQIKVENINIINSKGVAVGNNNIISDDNTTYLIPFDTWTDDTVDT